MHAKMIAVATVGCFLLLPGCASVQPGVKDTVAPRVKAGDFEYVDGILGRGYQAPIQDVWCATLAAMSDLRVSAADQKQKGEKWLIQGALRDGNRVTIEVIRKATGTTLVEVQVGWIGDRVQSEFIHQAIATRLGDADFDVAGCHMRPPA